ncbi:MAG: LytR C-terminal domain-containing protein [Longimicrobiales bacterium]
MLRRILLLALLIALAGALATAVLVLGDDADESSSDAAAPFDPADVPLEARTRVEVLNAAGRDALARTITAQLRDAGFDVVYYGNAPRGSAASLVLARGPDTAAALAVAAALGIDSVVARPDADAVLDVTVILGRDWPESPRPR